MYMCVSHIALYLNVFIDSVMRSLIYWHVQIYWQKPSLTSDFETDFNKKKKTNVKIV